MTNDVEYLNYSVINTNSVITAAVIIAYVLLTFRDEFLVQMILLWRER